MESTMKVPREYELCAPTVRALGSLGGAGSIQDIAQAVINQMRLPEELVWQTRGNTCQTELEYRLAWARTVLKTCGFVDNPERGIWRLTEKGHKNPSIDSDGIRRDYLKQRSLSLSEVSESSIYYEYEEDSIEDEMWNSMVMEQFLAGYSEEDMRYDEV